MHFPTFLVFRTAPTCLLLVRVADDKTLIWLLSPQVSFFPSFFFIVPTYCGSSSERAGKSIKGNEKTETIFEIQTSAISESLFPSSSESGSVSKNEIKLWVRDMVTQADHRNFKMMLKQKGGCRRFTVSTLISPPRPNVLVLNETLPQSHWYKIPFHFMATSDPIPGHYCCSLAGRKFSQNIARYTWCMHERIEEFQELYCLYYSTLLGPTFPPDHNHG